MPRGLRLLGAVDLLGVAAGRGSEQMRTACAARFDAREGVSVVASPHTLLPQKICGYFSCFSFNAVYLFCDGGVVVKAIASELCDTAFDSRRRVFK